MRSHPWGALLMIVLIGEIDADGSSVLAQKLHSLQQESNVIVDLMDVTDLSIEAANVLAAAKQRSDAAGWGFAVVCPSGPCTSAIRDAGQLESLQPVATRQLARAQLQAV